MDFFLFNAAMKLPWHWTRKNIQWMDQFIIMCSILFYSPCLCFIFIGGCWCTGCLLSKSKQEARLVTMFDLVSLYSLRWLCKVICILMVVGINRYKATNKFNREIFQGDIGIHLWCNCFHLDIKSFMHVGIYHF